MAPVNPTAPARRTAECCHLFVTLAVLVGSSLFFAGCGQQVESALPPPVPQVAVSPSLEATAASWVRAYREQVGVPQFDLVPMADPAMFDSVQRGEALIAITGLEPPQGWFATPLALESLAVVVHPSNPVRDLGLEALTDMFTGRLASWSAIGGEEIAVQPIVLPPGDAVRERFDAALLEGSRIWPGARIAPSPEAVIELVGIDRGAIGYVPASQLAESVRVIRLNGREPQVVISGNASYPLSFTIVATAPQEPEGDVRDFLAWLQAERLRQP